MGEPPASGCIGQQQRNIADSPCPTFKRAGQGGRKTARQACELQHGRRILRTQNHFQAIRSEEHTSELQSLMRISYAVFCLKKKINKQTKNYTSNSEER